MTAKKDKATAASGGRPLTPKQEKFCQKYIELGNASEAYREAYNTSRMKPESVNRLAKQLLDNIKITSRLSELRATHAERHNVDVDLLMTELEEARTLAKQIEQPAAMVAATMGKAKIVGLDKLVLDHRDPDGAFSKPSVIQLVAPAENDSCED